MMNLSSCVTLLVTLGVGKIPIAPGTWGSLVALLLWWFLLPLNLPIQGILILIAFLLGWIGTHFYEKWNQRHDPKEVVIDELVGMWLTLLGAHKNISIFIIGFFLFRLFDIWKPFPIRWLDQKVPGAFGTMIDDVLAAGFAYVSLKLIVAWGLPVF